jgi:catechol 2,3-dioxygenase-like lactoylglutathione lyase family enzyme
MKLQKIYTALLTADLAASEGWYTKLLGRGPDHRPMDTLVQWELFDQGGLMLSSSDEIAGRGVMFLYVDDVAAERRRLQGLGIVLGDDIEGDYSTLAQVRDPDGQCASLRTLGVTWARSCHRASWSCIKRSTRFCGVIGIRSASLALMAHETSAKCTCRTCTNSP